MKADAEQRLDEAMRREADGAKPLRLDGLAAAGPAPGLHDIPRPSGGEVELHFNLADWDATTAFVGEAPKQRWLVDEVIPLGVAGIIAAAGDVGKSYTALELCLRVSGGPRGDQAEPPLLGGYVASYGAAVFVTAEDGRNSVHRRLRALDPSGVRQQERQHPLYIVPLPDAGGPFAIVAEEYGKALPTAAFAALHTVLKSVPELALVVIDPLACFAYADINADPQAAALVMALLNMLAAETGATVLVTHHVRKEREAPKNAQEARNIIRGSSALVDQARVAVVLWTPDERDSRRICKTLGDKFVLNKVVHCAVVKSNDGANRSMRTLVRMDNGFLRDVTDMVRARGGSRDDLLGHLVASIAAAAEAGRPYSKTGENGLYKRRAEMGAALAAQTRAWFDGAGQELEETKKVVVALAVATSTKWLDVPDGKFAQGKGIFEAGAGTGKAGRKGSPA